MHPTHSNALQRSPTLTNESLTNFPLELATWWAHGTRCCLYLVPKQFEQSSRKPAKFGFALGISLLRIGSDPERFVYE